MWQSRHPRRRQQDVPTVGGATSTDTFFARSTNSGITYSLPVNLSQGNFNRESWLPNIGTGHRFGPLPTHFYMLTNLAGDDFYPLGAGAEILFALFDTGAAEVFINNVLPNRVAAGNFGDTDAGHLSVSGIETANVRLNGLSRRNPQGVPFAAQGQPNAAEAEAGGISLGPPVQPLNATLLGTPVTNRIVARIDYTTELVDTTLVRGPDIKFFMPGDADIPFSSVRLTLELFTPPGGVSGRTRADLPYLRNIVLRHAGATVSDDQSVPNPINFLYDSATTITIIGDAVATGLGLASGTGVFDCLQGTNNGYTLDSIVIDGENAPFTINRADVCWSQGALQYPASYDGVIGSNLLDQLSVVIDIPNRRLGLSWP